MKHKATSFLVLAFSVLLLSSSSNAANRGAKYDYFPENTLLRVVANRLDKMGLSTKAIQSLIPASRGETCTVSGQKAIFLAEESPSSLLIVLPASILTDGKIHFGIRPGIMHPDVPVVARTDNKGGVSAPYSLSAKIEGLAREFHAKASAGRLGEMNIEEFHKQMEDAWQEALREDSFVSPSVILVFGPTRK